MIGGGRLSDYVKLDHGYDADGTFDGTTVMLDMAGYDGCLFIVCGTTVAPGATHFISKIRVVSNTTAAGAGTDHEIAEAVTTDGGTTKTLAAANMGTAAVTTATDQNLVILDVKADQMYAGDQYIGLVTEKGGTGATFPFHWVAIRYRGTAYKDMFQTTRTAFQYDGDL